MARKIIFLTAVFFMMICNSMVMAGEPGRAFKALNAPEKNIAPEKVLEDIKKKELYNNQYNYQIQPPQVFRGRNYKEHDISCNFYIDGNAYDRRDKRWGVSATYRITFDK